MSQNTGDRLKLFRDRIIGGGALTFEEAVELSTYAPKAGLYALADEVRQHFTGNRFDMCSITNARSGRCPEDCKWCAQSAHYETNIETYELIDPETAVQKALENEQHGVNKYSLVASGKRISKKHLEEVCNIYREIGKRSHISLCTSMGLIDKESLQQLKDAGVKMYHCNVETARSFFPQVCTTHSYEEKLQTIQWVKEVGLEVCSGGIIGMGETMTQRIEMAFELKSLEVQSIPMNILFPIDGTPLEKQSPLSDDEVLTSIALFRLINPTAYIRFAGGRKLISHIQHLALRAGINASLVGNLLTTAGGDISEDITAFRSAGFNAGKCH
ncbi:MAG: biotin synthase BioB [Chlorobiales bacterium]|nr:biotin synthase BioB [Chlorobiales bacterium]